VSIEAGISYHHFLPKRQGFNWLSHYSSVDPIHDVYGIEVCGILQRDDAVEIQKLLMVMFPAWMPG